MNKTSNRKLTRVSQTLRKNMTKEERKLWYDFLKKLPVVVNRQKVVGNYILDFYCASRKLAIEIDGSGHFESEKEEKDSIRTNFLNGLGIKVVRYTNLEINCKFEEVCEDLYRKIIK